ncbi:bleomycin resistance family protein [Paraburkholderia guartelaensis]|jgi:catechol 2,3-dioxygenase-like lactoylglutathione lyase family enzyme|uniref:Bleomycin resistance family protein n=1 Tax=Paraburkholderia guartelaensis TaxID=2546446 RepID=A0A4R5LM81_9BURK|nr:VOC family protein [Paraburkholderia guartelaensis]TDG10971.1 bleomycin resistance family protein [Paraburkholderia guartelaensis]
MTDTNTLRPFAFVLAVQDLERNAAYFRDVLGFRVDWADATDWRIVTRGGVRIMLGHCPDALSPAATGDHSYFGYLEVDDVQAFHDEIAQRGAIVLQPPVDRPYGMRECTVATPDGHRFVVGQSIT